jgi:hypothetical protein
MIVIIQCASKKQPGAGHLRMRSGQRVVFVARPELAPKGSEVFWARPDDLSDMAGTTWRVQVEAANSGGGGGTGLLRAFELYQPAAYRRVANTFGIQNLFILSAGWGLVRADYRLPQYDITFSNQAEPYKRRQPSDRYQDFNQLPVTPAGPVVFLGGRDYLPLFSSLTRSLKATVIVPFRSAPADQNTGVTEDGNVRFVPYRTTAKTNWHYGCAERLCSEPTFLER